MFSSIVDMHICSAWRIRCQNQIHKTLRCLFPYNHPICFMATTLYVWWNSRCWEEREERWRGCSSRGDCRSEIVLFLAMDLFYMIRQWHWTLAWGVPTSHPPPPPDVVCNGHFKMLGTSRAQVQFCENWTVMMRWLVRAYFDVLEICFL